MTSNLSIVEYGRGSFISENELEELVNVISEADVNMWSSIDNIVCEFSQYAGSIATVPMEKLPLVIDRIKEKVFKKI